MNAEIVEIQCSIEKPKIEKSILGFLLELVLRKCTKFSVMMLSKKTKVRDTNSHDTS